MTTKRIAINIGGGYVPGLDRVVAGAVLAAGGLGWEIHGIRDGYDGILAPERYRDGGMVALDARGVELAGGHGSSLLGTAARNDPFRMRTATDGHEIEEADRSDELLQRLNDGGIEAVISIVGGSAVTGLHALSVAYRLWRKGLPTICVPKSVENEIAGVPQAFGYNSVLDHATALLEHLRTAARDAGRIAVVELPGHHAGWLALQSGMATLADVVLIPEIPYDAGKIAAAIDGREREGRHPALVVVAEGARPATRPSSPAQPGTGGGLRASLAPNADPDFGEGRHVIDRQGAAAHVVAAALARLTDREILPLALGPLLRGGAPTAVDRQLGLAFGAGAVRGLSEGRSGDLVIWQPPDVGFVPIVEALNRVRTVPAASAFVSIARTLGISLGD